MRPFEVRPIRIEREVKPGDDVAELILDAGYEPHPDDVLAIAHTIVSKAEGAIVDLSEVEPSPFAETLAERLGKDPKVVEVVLREAETVVRVGPHFILTEVRGGMVCANSGVDESNAPPGHVIVLPEDPDASARRIRCRIREETGVDVGVIITDTQGRPFREGVIGVAIGASGVPTLVDRRGDRDLYGRELEITVVATGDLLAAAAELAMGQADEGTPAAVIRGVRRALIDKGGPDTAAALVRDPGEDIFR
ncbi:MAG: coenzyme F420-0:L-glutamate ligase [Methanopyri archaeon]|nr:coenzyme F420-0:L-glutamate ligase [Methanopyri archaeon]